MSTLIMSAEVMFPKSRERYGFGIRKVSTIHIEKSWKEFTGTAEIVLPRNVPDFEKIEADKLFELGDPVTIRFGYGPGEMPVEFEGYISDVSDGIPYRLKCEDEMFNLKRGSVTVSKKNISLKQLLSEIAPGYEVVCPDTPLGTVRYTNVAPVAILENIKKELGIYFYFTGKVLHAADGNSQDGDIIKILLEKNAVSENLNKKSLADEKVLVRFKSLQKNGKYLVHEEGDKHGTVQVRNWPYLTQAEIELRAKRIMELQKTKGFDGTITLFGIPRVQLGNKIDIKSLFFKSMEGVFHIDKIVKDFSREGIRQELTIGNKAG